MSSLKVVAYLAATALLAGCGSGAAKPASHSRSVATGCGSPTTRIASKLVLGNVAPAPRVSGSEGVAVEVISSFARNEMTFPTAHPANAVCEISRHRSRDGAATVVYKALRPATITFFSTFTRATPTMMPAMLGRLIVRGGG